MTFSIAARCGKTNMLGVAVSSSSACVAARCAHARASVGAVLTQNITDPTLGPRGLDLMAEGLSASEALARLRAETPFIEYRQLLIIDKRGRTASHSGAKALGIYTTAETEDAVAGGNILANEDVPKRMVAAFHAARGAELGDRIVAAMKAGLDAGGETGPVHSSGMLLVRDVGWAIADLRVDWHETDPIGELGRLWELWKPQMEDYVMRGINPGVAPTFGVPGAR